jgi:paraquat-inducible protein B
MLQSIDIEGLVSSATGTLRALEQLLRSPELKSAVAGLDGTLTGTSDALTRLNNELTPLLKRADQTLADYGKLAVTLEKRVGPLATNVEQRLATMSTDFSTLTDNLNASIDPIAAAATDALREASGAMRAISNLAGDGSSTRYELSQLLTEATRAARSLRDLADYLERHPKALIQGKR